MAEAKLTKVARGAGSLQDGKAVADAFSALLLWALAHDLEQHAEDGDTIAAECLELVRAVGPQP